MLQATQAIAALAAGQQQLQQQLLQQQQNLPEGGAAPLAPRRPPGVAVNFDHPFAPVGANPAEYGEGERRSLFTHLDYSNTVEFLTTLDKLKSDGSYALDAQREETIALSSLSFYSSPIRAALRSLLEYVTDDAAQLDPEQLREALELIINSYEAIDSYLQERAAYLRLKARNMHNTGDTYSVPLAHRRLLENVRAAPTLGSAQLEENLTRQGRAANQQLDKIIAKELAEQLSLVLRSERSRREDRGEGSRAGVQRGRKGGRGDGGDRPGKGGGGRGGRGSGSSGSSGGGAAAPPPRL